MAAASREKRGIAAPMDQKMEEGEGNPESSLMGPGNRSSLGNPALSNGHSPSSSVSPESPSSRSEAAVTTPVSESTFLRLNHLDLHGDDASSPQGDAIGKKKKRAPRAVTGDKNGRGLRQFSMKVCEKVESKGRTTYNEVADELVAEFTDPNNNLDSSDQQQYDEKNIRRRVYDALNVLMAMDIISKDKKEITWKGLPRTSLADIQELKAERIALKSRIEKKSAYLKDLQGQYSGLKNLVERNQQLFSSGNAPSGGVALPFILIQTRPHATVEVEISEDMQLVHFDFNSTPFELHGDDYVLKAMMKSSERQLSSEPPQRPVITDDFGDFTSTTTQSHTASLPNPSASRKVAYSPPMPGILKGRSKQLENH